MRIILASQSPRRKSILEDAGITFETIPSLFDESRIHPTTKESYVMELSLEKAKEVFLKHQDAVVIGADTIVYFKNNKEHYLGKPKNEDDAKRMLKMLSGNTHQVLTGVTILSNTIQESFYTEANVTFKSLTSEDIIAYINTKEPFDKAGSYAIQGEGHKLIDTYDGDFFTIMGLPIKEVLQRLKKIKTS
jgi:septum formation protein